MKRRALGKGIEAIISNEAAEPSGVIIEDIEISHIYPNPDQPRKLFKPETIRELAESIKESGLIQPLVVFQEGNKFYILVGERRWRAAQLLKWEKIPAIVRDLTKQEKLITALIENIQREDLNAIEIAQGIRQLMDKTSLNQEQAAGKLGLNRSTLANFLRLLKLPDPIKQSLVSEEITPGHARALLALESNEEIGLIFDKILKRSLSVRQTEAMVRQQLKKPRQKQSVEIDPDIKKMEDKLIRHFSTKVKLSYPGNGRGKIEIYFDKLEEFERILELMTKE